MELTVCDRCARHVRVTDAICPFCGANARRRSRLRRLLAIAPAAALTLVSANALGGDTTSAPGADAAADDAIAEDAAPDDAADAFDSREPIRDAVAIYGAPSPPSRGCAGCSVGAPSDPVLPALGAAALIIAQRRKRRR